MIFNKLDLLLPVVDNEESAAQADCSFAKREYPGSFDAFCGSSDSKPAGAGSTFSEGFNVSAAALPTEPSSYGIEMIGSVIPGNRKEWTPTFAIVKGFHKFGTGISTSGQDGLKVNLGFSIRSSAALCGSVPHRTSLFSGGAL